MKLKKLKLNNIGVHKELEVEFGGFTTISGANAEGKTTIDNAIIEAIEGSDIPLLTNGEESGSIEAYYDNDLSVKIPFRKDGKEQPVIRQGNMRLEKPRAQLKEWHNDARIRAIDFFSGKGAELKKYQTDTIMSILKVSLNESELKGITNGEIPLSEFFAVEHPLNYIRRLVNERDGYYYTKRAKNNEGIQTITHSNNTLYGKICEGLMKAGIDPMLFDADEYRTVSVTDKIKMLRDQIDANKDIELAEFTLANYGSTRSNAKLKFDSDMEATKNRFKNKNDTQIKSLEVEIKALEEMLARKMGELEKAKSNYDDKLKVELAPIASQYESEIKRIDSQKQQAEIVLKNSVKYNIDSLQTEIDTVQAVKEVLPAYDTWVEGSNQYVSMKEESDRLTEVIARLRKLPSDILKREKLPIDGLSMNEEGEFVIVNSHDVPVRLNQLSGYERLKLSLDVSIARLGEIRVLIIPQWAEIDPENKQKIKDYLRQKDVQGIAIEVGTGKIKIDKE